MIRAADGYELILGSSIDPQFGPVLLFGSGGQLVEIFRDRALGTAAADFDAGAQNDGANARSTRRWAACEDARRWIAPLWNKS